MSGTVSISDIVVCIRAIWKKKWIVVVTVLIGFLLGLILKGGSSKDEYSTYTTIYSSTYGSYTESMAGVDAMLSYANVIMSNKVCERAITMLDTYELDVETLQEVLSVDYDSEISPIITITVTTNEEQECIDIANAVASAFIIEMQNITGERNVQVLDEAKSAEISSSALKQIAVMCLVLMMLSGVVTCGVIFVYEFFQTRLRTVSQISEMVDVKIIGIIPVYDRNAVK